MKKAKNREKKAVVVFFSFVASWIYSTLSNSTSKVSVELGGITPGWPRAP